MSNAIENRKIIPGIRRLAESERVVREGCEVVNVLPTLHRRVRETRRGMVIDKTIDLSCLVDLPPGQIAEVSPDLQRVIDLNGRITIDYVGNISVHNNGHENK